MLSSQSTSYEFPDTSEGKVTVIDCEGKFSDEERLSLVNKILEVPFNVPANSSRMHFRIEHMGKHFYIKVGIITRQAAQKAIYETLKTISIDTTNSESSIISTENVRWDFSVNVAPLQQLIYRKMFVKEYDKIVEVEYTVDLDLGSEFQSIDFNNNSIRKAAEELNLDPDELVKAMEDLSTKFYYRIRDELDYYPPHDMGLRQFMFRIDRTSRRIEMIFIDLEWFDPPV